MLLLNYCLSFFLVILIFPFDQTEGVLVEKKDLFFRLPGNVSFNVRSVDYYTDDEGHSCFSFLSRNKKQKIYRYDYETQELIDSIDLVRFHTRFQGHKSINDDSVLVYDYVHSALFLINKQGHLLKRYNINNDYVDPKVWTPMPIVYKDGYVYLGGYLYNPKGKYKPSPIFLKLDLETGEKQYLYHYPDIYLRNNWGGDGVGYWFYYDFIEDENMFIFSFPFDEYVHLTNFEDIDTSILMKSKYLSRAEPYSYFKFIEPDLRKSCKHFVENPTYKNILYDPYRKLFYRIGEYPQEFEGMKWRKKITIIVYNVNYKYITEKTIEDYHGNAPYTMFVGKRGLHFQYVVNESVMAFKTFVLTNK